MPVLNFEDISPEFLRKFESHLKDKYNLRINSVHSLMKNIRKLMLREYNLGTISDHPFKKYKLKTETTQRAYLTTDEIEAIEDYQPTNPSQHLAKDMFIFALYTGLRFSDICFITPDNIIQTTNEQGKKVYKAYFMMFKTGELISK